MDSIRMNQKYDNITDRGAADTVADYLQSALKIIQLVHPECCGFEADVDCGSDHDDDINFYIVIKKREL